MNAFGSEQQPITLAEVELQVSTYQKALKELDRSVQSAENDLYRWRNQRDDMKKRVAVWEVFAKTLKEL